MVEHGSSAPMFHFGLWPVIAALVDGPDEKARAVVRGRPGGAAPVDPRGASLRRRHRRWPGGPRWPRPLQAYAAGDELLAPVEWWRRFLRLFTLEAAIADGWGDPVPVLRADLSAYEQAGEAPLARICRDTAAPRRSRGPAGPRRLDGVPPRCGRTG